MSTIEQPIEVKITEERPQTEEEKITHEPPKEETIQEVPTKPELIIEEVSDDEEEKKVVVPKIPPPTLEECQKKTQELAALVDAQIQIIGAACGKIFEVYHTASRDPKAERLQGIMQGQEILGINQQTIGKFSTFQQELHVVSKMGKEWYEPTITDARLLSLLEEKRLELFDAKIDAFRKSGMHDKLS